MKGLSFKIKERNCTKGEKNTKRMKKGIEMIRQYHMIQEEDHIIAGVSGGPDSVYLLFLLLEYQKQKPFSISVVHVEHGIRGEESKRDAEFVRQLCKREKIPFFLFEVDARKEAKEKRLSLEEACRVLRYRSFEKAMEQYKGDKIAIAHNEEDQAETMVWNLARGSGLTGLCGIWPVRGRIIRPLLTTSRREIEGWLKKNQIETCQDITNTQDIYTRNKIRRKILPKLQEEINVQSSRHIAQACYKIQKAECLLQKMTDIAQKECVEQKENQILIQIEKFERQEEIIQEYLLRRCVEILTGSLKNVTQKHIENLRNISKKADGRQISLPFDVVGKKENGNLILCTAESLKKRKNKKIHKIYAEITAPCQMNLGNATVECCIEESKSQIIPEKSYTKWIDYDTIKDKLILRNRLPGDYLIINRSGGKKKLKDYFIDQKIPKDQRDSVLLLADGSHILWVVGYRISEACKVKENTRKILKIKITEEN